ncbi:MAG: chorismate mutase [Clostridiales bacterium]|nr:chorismate mutase [Clostridiales bacterium]MCD7827364.1 chorismate mutase [Clostridiales bacterium]
MDIKELRQQINDIDTELTELFNRRMNVSLEVAKYKSENNMPVLDKTREREVMERAAAASDPDVQNYTRILYSDIFNMSRSYQHKVINGNSPLNEKIKRVLDSNPKLFPENVKVACQGVEGSYAQHACDRIFRYPIISYYENWNGVFDAVSSGQCDYGILPIENSTAGSVNKVYDLMKTHNCFIVRSIRLKVDHSLLTKNWTKLSEINEIYSHEQALNQCSDFINSLGSGVKTVEVRNTAEAAKMVAQSDRTDVAAIASADCSELYSLTEIQGAIQNAKNNYTRFICIAKDLQIFPGADRTSLMMTTSHKPGALYSVMSKFNAHGINLLKLESRPLPDKDFEFMFYFDIEASVYGDDLYSLFDELYAENYNFTYFGSYSEIL